jgi:transcriptional regulator
MYTPKHFEMTDGTEVLTFMQQYSFATIVSIQNNLPVATHLPFVIKEDEQQITLLSHFAKANGQIAGIAGQEVLVIFAEPHAYISPSNYEKQQNVPTWNYVAVHAYGEIKIITDDDKAMLLLEDMINTFEEGYLKQWQSLDQSYRQKMLKGITAFEIAVNKIEGKKKLSQNRSELERESIISNLNKSLHTSEKSIAAYMENNEQSLS